MITFDDLLKGFQATGIQPGDLVMFHSSYKSFGGVQGGADVVIDALLDLVEPAKGGAVFFPTYGVAAWCGNHYWDISETPSEMGAITEAARQRYGWRTRHPIHSWQILGAWRDEFQFENVESYSDRGPLGLFERENGLIISAGVPWDDTFTFVHYVEQKAGAHWRRVKNFAGMYVDSWGSAELRTYRMSVRRTLDTITHVAPLYDEVLVPSGVVKQTQVGASTVSYFRAREYMDAVVPLVQSCGELFYYEKGWRE